MKHGPRPAIHMEKQLGWAYKLGGMEPWRISRVGQTVLARVIESQIWHPLASSAGGGWVGSGKGQWPLPTFLSGRELFPSSNLDAGQFSSSLCATGAFQPATPVLELRGRESEQVCVRIL